MLISVRWLNRLFDSGLTLEALTETLDRAGLEVESVTDLGIGSGKIVVARVLEVVKHPGADKLHLVRADLGAGEPARIVCGADNLYPGMIVPCAIPGAVLPGDFKIEKSKIRGETSEGMLCSARELGFGADRSGILELSEEYELGAPFDAVIDVAITPNRPDWLSLMGVARELAAMLGRPIEPPAQSFEEGPDETAKLIKLQIDAPDGCPRYMLRCIAGVGVGPSPVWMRRALESVGSRSIDNVVDATNYVLRELGHPLHAFDADRIRGGRIVVRRAKEGEAFTALDDRELKLSAEDLVIADAEGPIALAGVIGGRESEVTEATENVALECACFDPISIRRTARRHGFSTDASHRFERGTDRIGLVQSLERTAYFIQKLAGGVIARAPLDEHHAPENPPAPIELSVEKVNRHLGLRLDSARIADCLRRLQFRVDPPSNGSLRVSPPSFRLDARQDVDLIEEVARIHGYENIPETIPAIAARADAPADRRGALESDLRALLLGRGFCEAIHYSFISDDEARRVGFDPAAQPRLANPISADQVVMRPSLLPGLIAAAERNRRQGADSIRLFEIGRVYRGGAQAGDESAEPARLGLILAGATPVNWAEPSRPFDFHDMKGAVEAIGGTIGLGAPRVERLADSAILHPGRAASVRWMGRAFGVIGELHPDLTEAMKTRACVALLDLEELLDAAAALSRRFAAIPNLPGSERDFALIVDESLAARDLIEAAAAAGKPLLERVEVIDLYRGGHVPDGKKSLALRFTLRSPETTLTDAQINEVMRRIQAELETRCGATLRT